MQSDFKFKARACWVGLKQVLRLPLIADWNHIALRLALGIEAGEISRDCFLAPTVRWDGFGSQALSRVSIMATAAHLGLRYAHRPFWKVAHAEGDPALWTERCEAVLRLGEGAPLVEDCGLPQIEALDLFTRRDLWTVPHVISVRHMYAYCNHRPAIYREVVHPVLVPRESSRPLRLAVHVRRGDISLNSDRHRFTSSSKVGATVGAILAAVSAEGIPCEAEIFTNAAAGELGDLEAMGCRIRGDTGALETFDLLRSADILVTAKSAFSYLAGLYCAGVVVYEPFSERPLPGWITIGSDGSVPADAVRAALTVHHG